MGRFITIVKRNRIPRQACLGLIEAGNFYAYQTVLDRIPRQACLGLIEARPPFVHYTFIIRVFRGKLASASLKPYFARGRRRAGGVGRIPRQACLGLIEAGLSDSAATRDHAVFRGKLASASLKHPTRLY